MITQREQQEESMEQMAQRRPQTEMMRLYLYISAPFARTLAVSCVWCGEPAGKIDLLAADEAHIWVKRGKLCPPCYDKQQEAMGEC